MAEHLTPLDATFLELEQSDETAHMHIGGLLVFDPLPDGSVPTFEDGLRHYKQRIGVLPRYRERLSVPHTGGLSWPTWVPDDNFDIRNHVHRAALPAPGGEQELLDWLGDYWSHRLDRKRPLWDAVMLEGLEGGRWAICTKTHHCLVDGVGSLDVGHVLMDTAPDADEIPVPHSSRHVPEAGPDGLLTIPSLFVRGAVTGFELATHPRRLRKLFERGAALAELVIKDELIAAPKSSLNRPIGIERRFAVVRASLEDVKAVKDELGGTVNDVVLATVSGGLRRLLVERGDELPSQGLRAMVPMNIRSAGDKLALGNRITSLFVHLPVAEADALERYRLAKGNADGLKGGSQALGGSTLIDVAGVAPPAIHTFIARSLFASRLFNVTVTNVPGPQIPLYAMGARLHEIYPLVPIAAEHAVGIAVISYGGRLTFGVNADRDTVPDVDALVKGMEESFAELQELAKKQRAAGGGKKSVVAAA
ncbi:MAG: WS/DGAT/MGAT family O-acyltransferase [Thermoleophilaceae bacterium]